MAKRWILFVVALLAANVLAMIVLVVASRHDPEQVVPGYREELVRPQHRAAEPR